jgi:molybdopterin-binding protein
MTERIIRRAVPAAMLGHQRQIHQRTEWPGHATCELIRGRGATARNSGRARKEKDPGATPARVTRGLPALSARRRAYALAVPQFRISEAAGLLGISDDTVRRWVDLGKLSVGRDGSNRWVIDGAELAQFIRETASAARDPSEVRRSARNRFVGLVTSVVQDSVMAQVEMQCGPHRVVSLMSSEAVQELGLEPGVLAVAVIKATNVVVETPNRQKGHPVECDTLPA